MRAAGSAETSTRKAYTALQLDKSTADLVEAVQPGGSSTPCPPHSTGRCSSSRAECRSTATGRLIGALGVGGGAPEQDHGFADVALKALS
ncbi:heme-binding protein [Streptomyces avermitilis]|uniref:heme-binding protein n=1 Tax=Streptomyces avermitilis TaxID=33903 RepID=UPI0033E37355